MTGHAEWRDPVAVRRLAGEIARLDPGRPVKLMHVCGTHENAICRHGLRDLLPPWVRLVAGPGCPVCVCPAAEIDLAIRAAKAGAIVTTFGDVARVPARTTLMEARAAGADARVVYSVADAALFAAANPGREVVFFAVGFETTACTTAAVLRSGAPRNFSIIASHRYVPPALDALLATPDIGLDGFLLPGHATSVTGLHAYAPLAARHGVPMVVGGFEPVDVMVALRDLLARVGDGRGEAANAYRRAVRDDGNPAAMSAIFDVFELRDAAWRGIGTIPGSGLGLAPAHASRDATARLGLAPDPAIPDAEPGCRCGDVLLGRVEPEDCPLFGSACEPDNPVGPCMVAIEGTCQARYRHRGHA
ncbi:MAG: hydrogenase formation protein HypD [Deltaproteobacteria bacterium]|nr:hydrogenase formation protein HypD [Deltaproteobacteria bacterium]